MLQISLLLYMFVIFGELSTKLFARERNEKWWRPRISGDSEQLQSLPGSNGFEYNILNENYESTHFRKEQRDPNGVVRGSYGFKDPNGVFRLVRYIADNHGFRAQVSSNEQGVGSQNPANVNINRVSHPFMIDNEESSVDPHFATSGRLPDNIAGKQENKEEPLRYSLYTPFMPKYDMKGGGIGRITKHPLNVWTKDVSPGASVNVYPNEHNPYSNRLRPSSGIPGESNPPYPIRNRGVILPQNINTMRNVLGSPGLGNTDDDEPEHQFQMPVKEQSSYRPPNILNPLFLKPQIKVHTHLPDCDKVSSAVLCKPPYLFSRNYEYYNASLQTGVPGLNFQINNDESTKESNIADRQLQIEAILAEKLLKLAESGDETLPAVESTKPFLFPPSFTYLNKLEQNRKSDKNPSNKDTPCSEKHLSLKDLLKSRYLTEDLTVTTSLKRPILYNIISENPSVGSLLHGGWNHPMDFNYATMPNEVHRNMLSDLLRDPTILTSYVNLNKYSIMKNQKNVILLAKQNPPDSSHNPVLSFLEKLNALGLTISPKQDQESNTGDNKILTLAADKDKHVTNESSIEPNENGQMKENSSEHKKNDLIDNVAEKSNETKTNVPNNSVTHPPDSMIHDNTDSPEIQPTIIYENTNSPEVLHQNESKNPLYDSKFVVFDELEDLESDKEYFLNEDDKNVTRSNSSDWKKMLDEEINEEYQRTSKQRQSYFSNFSKLEPNNSSDKAESDERIFKLHDQPAPLYDSRGATIKPENVPLHLHRYVPPTGITSFPWKFAIPRPAPPRSVVIPPRPASLH